MPGINDRIGNYRLIEELPSGAYGLVFRGEHTFLINRVVAIKLLHRVHLNSQKERDSFIQEAKLLEVLEHPHVLPIIDAEFHEGVPYIVTKYAQNGTLRNRLQRQSQAPLPVEEAVTILLQIGEALQYAHQKNIIHRDLKPENILFSDKNDVLLADFGISVVLVSGKTKQVGIGGTLPYMAPEQFEGMISRKSDQYALGCIAYELLTGHQPHMIPNPTIESMWYHHAKVIPYSPSQFNPNLPEHIEKALLKAMAKDRDDRYANIADFMNALHAMPTSQARMFTITQEVRLTERTSELLKIDVKATEVEQVRTKPLNNIQVTDSEQTPVRLSSHIDNKYVPHEPDETVMGLTANIGLGSVAGIRNAGSSFENGNADSHALSSLNIGSQAVQNISPNGSPILAGQPSKTRDLNDIQSKAGPGPGTIPFPATLSSSKNEPTGEATAVPIIASASTAKPNGSSAVPPTKGGN